MATTSERVRQGLQKRGTTSFLVAAVVLGLLVGFATALLAVLIEASENLTEAFGDWTGWGVWAFLITIPIGLSISWWLNRSLGPGISGGGVTETMVGLSLYGGYLPTKLILPKLLATATTLGSGGSGGSEGPIAYVGASLGSTLARYTNFDHDRIRSLVAAGAGAGIGASFNAPIAGMLFAMEVILGSFAIRHLNAVVISSVVAAVTAELLVGEELILSSPAQRVGQPIELLLYVGLAVLAVAIGLLYLRALDITAAAKWPQRVPGWFKPLVYGVAVALIGAAFPESLGTGRSYLSGLLNIDDVGTWSGGPSGSSRSPRSPPRRSHAPAGVRLACSCRRSSSVARSGLPLRPWWSSCPGSTTSTSVRMRWSAWQPCLRRSPGRRSRR